MKYNSILIKNADFIVTLDKNNRLLRNSSLFIEKNQIIEIDTKRKQADLVINATGKIIIPGFVNCHHHMFQCAMRGMPRLQNQKIDKWIEIVCEMTMRMSEETIYYCALANMAELLLYGCTTTTDMLYIFPRKRNIFFEATIEAAKNIGIRFHPYRGSMSLSQKDDALFPDDVVQDSDTIAKQSEDLIRKYHNSKADTMLKIGLAPSTIFTNSAADYNNAVSLSDKYRINLQTHLSESEFENDYSLKKFKKRPLAYLQQCGWLGKRVSFAHCITVNSKEIENLARTNTNIIHCPISNARSPIGEPGIAPIWEMLQKKVNVAIGTDGAAGNDSSNVIEELRWARVLQGVRRESTYLKPNEVLKMGTTNGAKLLNWDDQIGSIEVGKCADIAIFNLNDRIEFAGAFWDPVTTLLSCQAQRADVVMVNGKIVVSDSELYTVSENSIAKGFHRSISQSN